MTEKAKFIDRFRAQVEHRNLNDRALIEGPLVHLDDRELQHDVREFSKHLPDVEYDELLRAARVAKDIRTYDEVARNMATQTNLLVSLEEEEKKGLVSEQDELRGQFGQILPVVLTVGCAAFLQGHVQASINCASIYARWPQSGGQQLGDWKLGAMNASPFFAAAVIGAPSALLFNYWIGRRGAITVAAVMILASSLGAAWTTSWWQLLCVRIVNGVGMGIKAVSTPILAGEIAFTQWRGSSTLMWQLCLFLAAAALLFINGKHLIPIVVFIYLFAAVYSPSLGPVPFTLASESFPLAQREAGCSIAISVNLFFAGVLTLCYPWLDGALKRWGGLAIFSGLNLAATGLVFFLVEETKGFSLEDLTMVFAVPKRKFVMFQLGYLKYLWRRHALGSKEDEPEFYTVAFHHRRNITGQDDDSDMWED
ncbi:Sugar carrier protein A [Cytospora mali]|uniref:Sugar carrier protein A n=1 Tax=Cytospora mali TaxID=578113 RepID=A0A194V0G8_CYTMA|nr:Sugar carrier protein A [Valsa mali var. pyri (nom. inval.)]